MGRVIRRPAASASRSSVSTRVNGRAERPLHPGNQVVDQWLVDHQLPVGEELDQHFAKKLVVGRTKCGRRGQAQPGAQVRKADMPFLRGRL